MIIGPISTQGNLIERLSKLPWWLLFMLLMGAFLTFQLLTNALYTEILEVVRKGLVVTVQVTLIAYFSALLIGLIAGLGRVSSNPVIFNLATLYVQIIRGVPMLVQIFYVTFVVSPALFNLAKFIGTLPFIVGMLGEKNFFLQINGSTIDFFPRVVFALALAYGGFEAENFRAGIESLGRGQMEAARSLGMSYFQAMRFIILPQAIRRIFPTLSNDFISMLKDSSLVSALGVRDVTQEARLYVATTFHFPETYNTLAFVYLAMTLILSLGLKWFEERWRKGGA